MERFLCKENYGREFCRSDGRSGTHDSRDDRRLIWILEKKKFGVHIAGIQSMQTSLRMRFAEEYFLSAKIKNVEKYLS